MEELEELEEEKKEKSSCAVVICFDEPKKEYLVYHIPSVREAIDMGLEVVFRRMRSDMYAHLGVTKAQWVYWRQGKRALPEWAVERIAELLGISRETILREGDKSEWMNNKMSRKNPKVKKRRRRAPRMLMWSEREETPAEQEAKHGGKTR